MTARTHIRHQPAADACRARPGMWLLIRPYPASYSAEATARLIRTGRLGAYRPAGSFDAETRPHPDGWAVWARHTPTKETP